MWWIESHCHPGQFPACEHSVLLLPGYIPEWARSRSRNYCAELAPAVKKKSYFFIIRSTALQDGVLRAIMAIRPSRRSRLLPSPSIICQVSARSTSGSSPAQRGQVFDLSHPFDWSIAYQKFASLFLPSTLIIGNSTTDRGLGRLIEEKKFSSLAVLLGLGNI